MIGAGYVGLVTGACLAGRGHDVTVVDVDEQRVAGINAARAPFFEPGLEGLLTKVVPTRLHATANLEQALRGTRLVMLAVGTPTTDGAIDLQQLVGACQSIGSLLVGRADRPVVIVKSTVVPGTTEQVLVPALEGASGLSVGDSLGLVVNPEFLTEGTAVADFEQPDRIVLGGSDEPAIAAVEELYAGLCAPILRTTPGTAEMIKYASNTLLANLISFSNEIANLGAAIGGIDIVDVMAGVHASRYLTTRTPGGPVTAEITSFLAAGCGYGGSCLPKDTQALVAWGAAQGVPMTLLAAVDEVNRTQPGRLVAIVAEELGDLKGRRIGVLGLSFKPGTDDVRESPAFPVIRGLLAGRAEVWAHDPRALEPARRVLGDLPGLRYEDDLDALVAQVEAIVLVTRWAEYAVLPSLLGGLTEPPLLVDGRRMIDKNAVPRYAGIGL